MEKGLVLQHIPVEEAPKVSGVYRFQGSRIVGGNQTKSVDSVVQVRHRLERGKDKWIVLFFGKSRIYPLEAFQGTWRYMGDNGRED